MTSIALRAGAFGVPRRSVAVCGALLALGFAIFVLAIGTGDFFIPPGDVLSTLLGRGDPANEFVIETLRMPRALTGVLVGGALATAGAVFQSLTRNPLGSPDFIGFTAGASAGAVAQITVIGGGGLAIAGGALVGCVATAAVVVLLSLRGGLAGYRLILIGVGMQAILVSLISYMLTRAKLEEVREASVWLNGSLNGRDWIHVEMVLVVLPVVIPLIVLFARPLQMLELGDDAARALGVGVDRARAVLLLSAVVLTAVATAAAGPISFVALAAPQIARRLTRAPGPNIVASALTGVVLLLAADFVAQRVFGEASLPVGIVTGVLGGVYLMWLLAREWRSR